MSAPFPVVIHHNPECGTSRNVLALIRAAGYAPIVIEYLSEGWTRPQLLALFAGANLTPRQALRETKSPAADLGLLADGVSDETILAAMIAHPILVNRPFVVTPKGVKLCRPKSEAVIELLERRPVEGFVKEDGEVVAPPAPRADVSVRVATEADIPAITAIYAHAVTTGTASYELTAPTEAEMLQRFRMLAASSFPYFVATSGQEIAGYAYAGPFRARPAYRFMAENSVYIAPTAQGRGVGRALMDKLVAELDALGFHQIIAVIGDGRRNLASVRLHTAIGFQPAGVIEGSGYKFERWLDTVLMELPLRGGILSSPDAASLPERLFRSTR